METLREYSVRPGTVHALRFDGTNERQLYQWFKPHLKDGTLMHQQSFYFLGKGGFTLTTKFTSSPVDWVDVEAEEGDFLVRYPQPDGSYHFSLMSEEDLHGNYQLVVKE